METFELSLKIMRSRIFWVWYSLMLLVNLAGSVIALILQGRCLLTYVCFALELVMFALLFVAIKTNKKALITTIILALVIYVEFPLLYLVYREIIVAYFLLGVVAITVFSPRKIRLVMIPLNFAVDILAICFADFINLPNRISDNVSLIAFNCFTFVANAVAAAVIAYALIYYYEKRKKELDLLNEKLQYSAVHDPLTDLNNRGFIVNTLIERMACNGPFYAAIIDIDDFKKVNDTYGHVTGDEVLKTLAEKMKYHIGNSGYVGRYGGEEFLLIFNINSESSVRSILNSMKDDFTKAVKTKYDIYTSFSCGLGCSSDYSEIEEFIVDIDKKLYEAKHNGKNQIV